MTPYIKILIIKQNINKEIHYEKEKKICNEIQKRNKRKKPYQKNKKVRSKQRRNKIMSNIFDKHKTLGIDGKSILGLYAINDQIAKQCSAPFMAPTLGVALRNYRNFIKTIPDTVSSNDFQLLLIGSYDTSSGIILTDQIEVVENG